MRHIDLIVVHCSATRSSADIGAREINQWHKDRGWSGIGYHYVIRRAGVIESGRAEAKIGAHAYGHNRHSIGICLIGGLNDEGDEVEGFERAFTRAQRSSLITLVTNLRQTYPGADVQGHRDLSPDVDGDGIIERHEWLKSCPCFNAGEVLG